MSVFRVVRVSPLSVEETWQRLTDWPLHAARVPLTRTVVQTDPPNRRGTRFVARTGIGRLAFDDPMEVTVWEPPGTTTPAGRFRLVKQGTSVTGWAEIEVHPRGRAAYVIWREELSFARLPRFLDPLTARAGRVVFALALRGLLRPDA
ncbi:SRPBCC family protein [Streptomyces apocyni]|uniref:SRPBCC family protein n=1 Tax=Streptomyces apocyni TaxID=2654677 RepID=UPI0012EA2520|nr:SRPBCC family protein [Streptomyces apocyni]